MAYFGVTATDAGLAAASDGEGLDEGLRRRLAGVTPGAPIVVMVHGYNYDPARPDADPHRSLFAFVPSRDCRRIRSWPTGLGFADDGGETGPGDRLRLAGDGGDTFRTCSGGAAPASPSSTTGRRSSASSWRRSCRSVQRLAPGRPVDLLAHSLGARVALAALPHLAEAPGRVILLGAAEFDGRAREGLAAVRSPSPPDVYNVTARANDPYDLAFETFARRRGWEERAVGRGLGDERPHWLDLQLDRPDVTAWINERGIRLKPPESRLCHWGFYTRSGALAVYQAILRRRPGWDIEALRAVPGLAAQEPRWSRLVRGVGPWSPDGGRIAFE